MLSNTFGKLFQSNPQQTLLLVMLSNSSADRLEYQFFLQEHGTQVEAIAARVICSTQATNPL